MKSLSQDFSFFGTVSVASRELYFNPELYNYVRPPIPLLPKNSYTDDVPRCQIPML